jgi:DNA-binding CsgD family transcriptional regulator
MVARVDPISLVEACYDLGASELRWMERLAELLQHLIRPTPMGVLVYHIRLADDGIHCSRPAQAGDADHAAKIVSALGRVSERMRSNKANLFEAGLSKVHTLAWRGLLRGSVEKLFLTEVEKRGPDWVYTLGAPGVRDVFMMPNHHMDGHGATCVMAGLRERGSLQPAERQMFHMFSAHIKAGMRLRRRLCELRAKMDAPPSQGAVLTPAGKLLHAEGEARESSAREALEAVTRRIDAARTERAGRDERALEIWQGLVDGRWSLVEHFDRDGKRFLLAHRNPEDVTDPRGLTNMESRVTALAVRGYSNKLIAYHLGIQEGTASSHLHRAQRKLGLESRVELVKTLGRHYPQATDPRFSTEPPRAGE